jgi:pimeloyl-ACP methyl ester carboxylesterase
MINGIYCNDIKHNSGINYLCEKGRRMKKYISFKGRKIFYSDEGNGTTVVLVHGYLESSAIWNSFAHILAKKFRVISVDLPGHGFSDIIEETQSMELLATSINVLLDALDIKKAFLTGHSLGGYVSLAFLELYTEKLLGYCLFHSHPFADSIETLQKREREIRIVNAGKKFLMYPENVKRMYADINLEKFSSSLERSKKIASEISAGGIVAVLKGMITRPSRLSAMEKGMVPCLWILGYMDNYIPCEEIQKKVHLPGNAELVILRNSGHLGFIEEEEKAVEVISRFVDKLKASYRRSL